MFLQVANYNLSGIQVIRTVKQLNFPSYDTFMRKKGQQMFFEDL